MALPSLSDTPTHGITLPSSGKKITIRPYLVKEEKILLMAAESQNVEKIFEDLTNVIQACIVKPDDFDASTLTTFDVEYVFLQLRSLSVGETAPLRLKCQDTKCDGETEVVVNLQDIKVENTDNVKQSEIISLTGNVSVEVSYPTVADLMRNPDIIANAEKSTSSYDTLKACIRKIMTEDEVFIFGESTEEEQENFIGEMTAKHTSEIGKYLDTVPSIIVHKEFECETCQKKNDIELRGLQDFFS